MVYEKCSTLYIYLKKLKYFLHKNNKLGYNILNNKKFKYYIHKLKILLNNNIKLNNIKYLDLIDISKYEIKNLPSEINISTMCASCKLNNKINLYNIEKYLKIDDNNVITKKINNNNIETLLPIVKSKRKKKIKKIIIKKIFIIKLQ